MFVPLFLSEKKRFSCNQRGTAANPFNNRPDFSSVPLPASRKIRLTVRPAFPLRKKRFSCNQRGTAANPLQYPSRLLRRASPRKPQNPVDSSSRFSSPKKNGFSAINAARRQNSCNTSPDFSAPSQSMAYLVSFKFLHPVFPKRRLRFFLFQPNTFPATAPHYSLLTNTRKNTRYK